MDNDSYIEMLEEALDEVEDEIKGAFIYGFLKGSGVGDDALKAFEAWKNSE